MATYEIVLMQSAVADMDELRKCDATRIADAMQKHLSHEPAKTSRSRIKRLRGIRDPDYRLRIGENRAFYTIDEQTRRVEILRVMHKAHTQSYYEERRR